VDEDEDDGNILDDHGEDEDSSSSFSTDRRLDSVGAKQSDDTSMKQKEAASVKHQQRMATNTCGGRQIGCTLWRQAIARRNNCMWWMGDWSPDQLSIKEAWSQLQAAVFVVVIVVFPLIAVVAFVHGLITDIFFPLQVHRSIGYLLFPFCRRDWIDVHTDDDCSGVTVADKSIEGMEAVVEAMRKIRPGEELFMRSFMSLLLDSMLLLNSK
jgi:hypothetical protein